MRFVLPVAALALASAAALPAQESQVPLPMMPVKNPPKFAPQPTTAAITPKDLMSRLYAYADDSMQGREFATAGNTKATAWIAEQVKKIGLVPMGDNGTYFQVLPVMTRTLDTKATIATPAGALRWTDDVIPRDQGPGQRPVAGVPVVFGGTWGQAGIITDAMAAGKVVIILPNAKAAEGTQVPGATINRGLVSARFKSAAGILIPSLDKIPAEVRAGLLEGTTYMKDDEPAQPAPSFAYVAASVAEALLGRPVDGLAPGTAGVATLTGNFSYVEAPIPNPSRNVVAMLPGSNPKLKGTYVAVGAHNDHVGVHGPGVDHDSVFLYNHLFRTGGAETAPPKLNAEQAALLKAKLDSVRKLRPARLDSTFNGADDDGTGTVSVLEIAEAMAAAKVKPARSVLFVWHTGEEVGLFGSQWFTDHPTVPRDSIVAQVNIDMVGRGDPWDLKEGKPGYVQVIGSRRLSTELGDLVEQVNTKGKHGLAFDYQFDANGHPEQYYCRSDHYMYARYGIPVTFFSTGGHPDYHMLTDEPQYINYQHMAQVVNYARDLVATLAGLDHRPVVDKPKPDPKGQCVQ